MLCNTQLVVYDLMAHICVVTHRIDLVVGSLPLVKEMKEAGYDLQIVGFGQSSVYHGDNEYCLLSDMEKA